MNKRVAHFGNMANDAFPVVEELQGMGEDVQLFISKESHVTALPQWELLKFKVEDIGDPYHPNWEKLNEDFSKPGWLHFIDLRSNHLTRLNRIRKEMGKYDLIIAHVPFFIYTYIFGKKYLPFEAGAIRYFEQGKTLYSKFRFWLMKRSYEKAKAVLVTNPDTIDLCEKYRLNWLFVPFAINMQRYKPMRGEPLPYEYVILCYSRQNWLEKGQDKLINAFAKFQKENKDSVLVLVKWGGDLDKSRNLIANLGLEDHVEWIPLMSKPLLVEWINKSTVVADQFNLGSSGTAGFEAMACGKPLVIYLSNPHFHRLYKEFPPVLNSRNEDDILNSLRICTDRKIRREIGGRSRRWVGEYHDVSLVAKRHLELYRKMLGDLEGKEEFSVK